MRSVPIHGSVDGPHGDALLEVRWGDVRVRGDKAEHGEAESAENKHQQSDYYTEYELAHGSSGTFYCGRRVDRALP
jgi:hypothetical protein